MTVAIVSSSIQEKSAKKVVVVVVVNNFIGCLATLLCTKTKSKCLYWSIKQQFYAEIQTILIIQHHKVNKKEKKTSN